VPAATTFAVTELLGDDSATTLIRAIRQRDQRPVLLRIPAATPPSLEVVRQLVHEHEIQQHLDQAWAIRPLAVEHYLDRLVLIQEDVPGQLLEALLRSALPLDRLLRLFIRMAAAVAAMQANGIIHGDLRPSNILVDMTADEIKLTGFGLASLGPDARESLRLAALAQDALAYLAPEQTGWMNRAVDQRSDLYSLGVTFYRMLTQRLPFSAGDPLEWAHCHIARLPMPPSELGSAIPRAISDVVMRLLAKEPEHRYQSARGLQLDLEQCLAEWNATGRIAPFTLGTKDASEAFRLPQKLYGREAELATLLRAFEGTAASGDPALVLVSGDAGTGKSSLVQQLRKPVAGERGYFIAGKFDQHRQNIPYATIAGAFRELVQNLLAESEERVASWKQQIGEALGHNCQLIIDIVPQLGLILGPQPPVPEVPPIDTRNRFHKAFCNFIGVFAKREHPIVLFLDDLQWADAGSLELIGALISDPGTRHLLLIGAYREQVNSSHPLSASSGRFSRDGVKMQSIVLGAFARQHLNMLVADALHCEPSRCEPLAKLVFDKTRGNPFFSIQFLTTLHQEGLVAFEPSRHVWTWDLAGIEAKGYTDNVVELMVAKLKRLPAPSQQALKLAGCLGNEFDSETLATISGRSREATEGDLREGIKEGLVLRHNHAYRFLHDRIQQAAYSRVSEAERPAAHLRIGRALLARLPQEAIGDKVFDIVNHLNRGTALVDSSDEKSRLAALNLLAGRKARASAAYASAASYLAAGNALLASDCWDTQHDLAFSLHIERARCEWLSGRPDIASDLLQSVMTHARSRVEQADAYRLKLNLLVTEDKHERGVQFALATLAELFGIELALHPTDEALRGAADRTLAELVSRTIEDLVFLPAMTDPDAIAAVAMLSASLPAAYPIDPRLHDLMTCEIVRLSFRFGTSEFSPHGYVIFGATLGRLFERWEDADRFGRVALDLIERHGFVQVKSRTYYAVSVFINFWMRHVRDVVPLLRDAIQSATEYGDEIHAGPAGRALILCRLFMGDSLADVAAEARAQDERAGRRSFQTLPYIIPDILRFVDELRGQKPHDVDESPADAIDLRNVRPLQAIYHCTYAALGKFLFEDYEGAVAEALGGRNFLAAAPARMLLAEYSYAAALALAAHCDRVAPSIRHEYLGMVAAHLEQFRLWQSRCPDNFLDRYNLIAAEIARLDGREQEAMKLYESAIDAARQNGFVRGEAVANECAARFYLQRGFDRIAGLYLREARACYSRWGADAKVRHLDTRYAHIMEQLAPIPTMPLETRGEQLDFRAAVKASQAVSSELELPGLLERLMRVVLEHAGAQKGMLVRRNGSLASVAAAEVENDRIVVSLASREVSASLASMGVLQYVERARETVLLDDAAGQHRFANDAYIRAVRPKSILCQPLLRQGTLIGILYLENNLVVGAFTPERIATLELLASQAAISLENAILFADHRRAETLLAQALAEREAILEHAMIGIAIVSLSERRFLRVNGRMEAISGYDRAELVGMSTLMLYPSWSEFDALGRAAYLDIAAGKAVSGEIRLRRKDGTLRWVHLIGTAIHPQDGAQACVWLVDDITDRKEAEARLRAAKEQAEAANQAKTMFLTTMSHELRTPLNAIIGFSELMGRQMYGPLGAPQYAEYADDIRGSGEHLLRLINDILDLSKAEIGKLELHEESVDLAATAETCQRLMQPQAERAGVTLRSKVIALPPLRADPRMMRQVLLNLLSNAVKFTPRGGTVELTGGRDSEGNLLLAVVDTGIGIAAPDIPRVFEAFTQIDNRLVRKYEGIGLGLPLSKVLVELHGGSLTLDSTLGHGTRVTMRLPLDRLSA
jgi:PAS domain S-box-containing protein